MLRRCWSHRSTGQTVQRHPKYVIFHDPIYVNSPFKFHIGFSADFTDWEVLCSQEVEAWLMGITGYRLVTKWEIRTLLNS
jgi:hypothetical protein